MMLSGFQNTRLKFLWQCWGDGSVAKSPIAPLVGPEFRSKLGRHGGMHMLAILGFQRERQGITRAIWRARLVRNPSSVKNRAIEKDI